MTVDLSKKTVVTVSFVAEQVTWWGHISSLFSSIHCARHPDRRCSSYINSGTCDAAAIFSSCKGESLFVRCNEL